MRDLGLKDTFDDVHGTGNDELRSAPCTPGPEHVTKRRVAVWRQESETTAIHTEDNSVCNSTCDQRIRQTSVKASDLKTMCLGERNK